MDTDNSDYEEMENKSCNNTSKKIKIKISKPSRPSYKAKSKSKRHGTSKMAFSKQELQVLSKTLLKLLPTKEESMNGTCSKLKEEDDDDIEDDMENPTRFLGFNFRC